MPRRKNWWPFLALMLSAAGSADAGVVLRMSGTVSAKEQRSGNVIDAVVVGAAYTGMIAYDVPAATYADPVYGHYQPASMTFEITVGGFGLTRSGAVPGSTYSQNTVVLRDDSQSPFQYDGAYITSLSDRTIDSPGGFSYRGEFAQLQLQDIDSVSDASDAITSTSLADFTPVLSRFSYSTLVFSKYDYFRSSATFQNTYFNDNYDLILTLDSLSVETAAVATPEPGALALAASGLPIGLICWLRSRKAKAAA